MKEIMTVIDGVTGETTVTEIDAPDIQPEQPPELEPALEQRVAQVEEKVNEIESNLVKGLNIIMTGGE